MEPKLTMAEWSALTRVVARAVDVGNAKLPLERRVSVERDKLTRADWRTLHALIAHAVEDGAGALAPLAAKLARLVG